MKSASSQASRLVSPPRFPPLLSAPQTTDHSTHRADSRHMANRQTPIVPPRHEWDRHGNFLLILTRRPFSRGGCLSSENRHYRHRLGHKHMGARPISRISVLPSREALRECSAPNVPALALPGIRDRNCKHSGQLAIICDRGFHLGTVSSWLSRLRQLASLRFDLTGNLAINQRNTESDLLLLQLSKFTSVTCSSLRSERGILPQLAVLYRIPTELDKYKVLQ